MKDCFIFDIWFSSKNSTEAAMEIGDVFIGVFKTHTKLFCKETIENLTKDQPGFSYLVLRSRPVVPRGRPLIAMSYRYNTWKALYFIVT